MKILTKKEADSLFEDLMVVTLMATESIRQQMTRHETDIKELIRAHSIVCERSTNAIYTLRGLFGVRVATEMHKQFNEMRRQEELKKEAKNDTLDEIDELDEIDALDGEKFREFEEREKFRIVLALGHTDYNIGRTAEALGISERTLRRKIKEYGIVLNP